MRDQIDRRRRWLCRREQLGSLSARRRGLLAARRRWRGARGRGGRAHPVGGEAEAW
jgi:hypothetical protein